MTQYAAMTIKTPLAEYRAAKGKTLAELASMIGVDASTLHRWETGAYPVPLRHVAALQKLTGISRRKLRPDVYGPAT